MFDANGKEIEKPMSLNEAIRYVEAEKRANTASTKRKKLVLKHEVVANAMIKLVMLAPMHDLIKQIMILRLGNPILKHKAISHLAIALQLGMKEGEVFKLEMEGVKIVAEYMKKCEMIDGIGKFNKEGNADDVKRIIL